MRKPSRNKEFLLKGQDLEDVFDLDIDFQTGEKINLLKPQIKSREGYL